MDVINTLSMVLKVIVAWRARRVWRAQINASFVGGLCGSTWASLQAIFLLLLIK